MSLVNKGKSWIIPDTDSLEYDFSSGIVVSMNWSVRSMSEKINHNSSDIIMQVWASTQSEHWQRQQEPGTSMGVQE